MFLKKSNFPFRRMEEAVDDLSNEATSQLCKNIALGPQRVLIQRGLLSLLFRFWCSLRTLDFLK